MVSTHFQEVYICSSSTTQMLSDTWIILLLTYLLPSPSTSIFLFVIHKFTSSSCLVPSSMLYTFGILYFSTLPRPMALSLLIRTLTRILHILWLYNFPSSWFWSQHSRVIIITILDIKTKIMLALLFSKISCLHAPKLVPSHNGHYNL